MPIPEVADETAWRSWRDRWSITAKTTYLNHGSFGPPPRRVAVAAEEWSRRLKSQPMDFFLRQCEPAMQAARAALAEFVGTQSENLVFADNATAAMNSVAVSFALTPGDEVLVTDHDYGAVLRIWQRACDKAGAKLVVQPVPLEVESAEQLCDAVLAGATPRTKLLVFSHVTSPTAIIFPAEQLTRRAQALNLAVCIDGPHAVAMIPLAIDRLDCDYYSASCHKWLSAPFGSGFLYVHPRRQATAQPAVLSWGTHAPLTTENRWTDEFTWAGTRDPAACLAVTEAIDFLQESVGLDAFRRRTHYLARMARQRIEALTGLSAFVPDDEQWYGSMIALPLPPGEPEPLQRALWEKYGIEIPVIRWREQRLIRVSCHLYNGMTDLDLLTDALGTLL